MPAVNLPPCGKLQFFDNNGNPLVGGKLYTYAAGTSTPLATYTDSTGATPNANPIILDSRGEAVAWLALSPYKWVLKDALDNLIWTVDNIETAEGLFIASNGSGLIGFIQAGTGAVARTAQAKMREQVTVTDFGASPSASASDNVTGILAAIAYANTLTSPELVIPAGNFSVNDTLNFDLPNGSTIRFIGTLVSSVSNKSAVVIGSASGNRFKYTIEGLKVERTANDYTGSSVGVELLNLAWADVQIRACSKFRVGGLVHGNGFGCAYNNIGLGFIHDNRCNMRLLVSNAAGGGFCNENNFFGGSFNHSSTYDVATYDAINLEVTHSAVNPINNNRFWGPSFEDAHPSSSNTVAAEINGDSNVLYHIRAERITSQATYQVKFTANAVNCGIVGHSFGVTDTNVNDLGVATVVETSNSLSIRKGTPNTAGKGVLRLRSTATSTARVLLIEDSAGNEVLTLRGGGEMYMPDPQKIFFAAAGSSYANDAAAAAAGVAIGQVYRNGSVLQVRVV